VEAQPAGQCGEVEHQRGIAEYELAQVDDHVVRGVDGLGEGAAAVPLRRPILVASTTQYRGVVIELDDVSNLHNRLTRGKGVKPHCQPAC
jgi:hypothetical protein